jgi:XTP/dITP diphosphohydrolase
MLEIVVATGNEHKIREIRQMCADMSVRFQSLRDVWGKAPDIAETGASFAENALIKARWVHDQLGGWALADDSGLEVDALGGAPGVRSARYAGEPADDAANRQLLLQSLRAESRRQARFRCEMALLDPSGRHYSASGECEGRIDFRERGDKGFGYDSIFLPSGYENSFAELDPAVKNKISHRAKALATLRKVLYELSGAQKQR